MPIRYWSLEKQRVQFSLWLIISSFCISFLDLMWIELETVWNTSNRFWKKIHWKKALRNSPVENVGKKWFLCTVKKVFITKHQVPLIMKDMVHILINTSYLIHSSLWMGHDFIFLHGIEWLDAIANRKSVGLDDKKSLLVISHGLNW